MCLAIPGKITKINGREVLVKYPDQTRKALLAEEKVQVGDWVMVQMGLVARVLSEKDAKEMLKAWQDQ